MVEHLTLSCQCDPILPECLPIEILRYELNTNQLNGSTTLDESVAQLETKLIRKTLTKTSSHKAKTAQLLRCLRPL